MNERCRPSGNDLVRSVFLAAWRAGVRHLWVSQAIALAGPLGLDARSVRTSLSRLEHQGWLCALRHGRQSRYALTAAAVVDAPRQRPLPWNGRWSVVAPVLRQPRLAAQLQGAGCRQLIAGLYVRPSGDTAALAALVLAHAPHARTLVFDADGIAGLDPAELAPLVSAAWDLTATAALYAAFIARCERAQQDAAGAPARLCFTLRALLLHDWRRACAADARLPAALLPPDWPAGRARQLHQRVDKLLRAGANAFVDSIVAKPCDNACFPTMRPDPGDAHCPAQ